MPETIAMQIEYLPVDALIPYENNPRINDAAVEPVANSIREFGFRSPIITDSRNVVIAGHTRLKAAKHLGLKTVPVIRASNLTDEQTKALRLVDNKTAEFAQWDFDLLGIELADIADIDMSEFGFEDIPAFADDFDDDFDLPYTDNTKWKRIALLLDHDEYDAIMACIKLVSQEMPEKEDGYVGNDAGRCIHEVVQQWAEQKKLSLQ